jgi:hypothetical protein
MSLAFLTFIISTCLTPSHSQAEVEKVSLEKYLWKKRIILVFDSSKGSGPWIKQSKIFEKSPKQNRERDLILIKVLSIPEPQSGKYRSLGSYPVLVIGKDGGIKAKYKKPVEMKKVYQLIDSMPMRKSEMIKQQP